MTNPPEYDDNYPSIVDVTDDTDDPRVMRFKPEGSRKAATIARRYMLNVMWLMLDEELRQNDGWMFGGVPNEFDRRRLTKAIKAEQRRLRREIEKLTHD